MKKCITLLLALCLLLTGCATVGGQGGDPAPTKPAEPYTPHYSDYTLNGMAVTVVSYTKDLSVMGGINNHYRSQAGQLFDVLATDTYRRCDQAAPEGVGYLQIAFSPYSDEGEEVYLVYKNDCVSAGYSGGRMRLYTAAEGTYDKVLSYLTEVQEHQNGHFRLDNGDSHAITYTLYHKGKATKVVNTGSEMPRVELVEDNTVRILLGDTMRLYHTDSGKGISLTGTHAAYGNRTVALYHEGAVSLYDQDIPTPLAQVYLTHPDQEVTPLQGMAFSEDGKDLHVVCRTADGAANDYTLNLSPLIKDSVRYLLGDWENSGGYVSESTAQNVGYKSLKKLRGKERALGHTFSAVPTHVYTLNGVKHYLTEIGYWEEGVYTVVTHLMIPDSLSAGYEVTPGDNQLTWDVEKDWFD